MKHFSQKAVTLKKKRRISIGPMRRPMKKRKVSLKNTTEIKKRRTAEQKKNRKKIGEHREREGNGSKRAEGKKQAFFL